MSARWLALAAALALTSAGCLDPVGVRCDDGTLCPDRTICATVAGATYCASADQLARCVGQPDGADCAIAGQDVGVCRDRVCVRAGCGDGLLAVNEQCDGDVLRDQGCRDLGYHGDAPLHCRDTCTYDLTACAPLGICGDAVVNGDEQCEGADVGGATCRIGGFYDDRPLGCNPACRYDFGDCRGRCGDDAINGPEDCDGAVDASHDTCGELGLGFHDVADPVTCGVDCRFDRTACDEFCGDGAISGGEQCDGPDLGLVDGNGDLALDCRDLGYYTGAVTCLSNCQRNLAACAGRCGDGQKQVNEVCDGTDFGVTTCTSNGFYTGTLACAQSCQEISTASCSGSCGDGMVNGPERCDGAAMPAGFSCGLFGFYRGALGCTPGCGAIVTTGCAGYCGDGVVDAGTAERCDGLLQAPLAATCATSGADGFGPLGCDPLCRPTFDRCEAGTWVDEPGLTLAGEASDVWAAGNQDVWFAIPSGGLTRIRRNVEQAWVALPDLPQRIEAIWATRGLVLAGGTGGHLFALVRAPVSPFTLSWQPVATPTLATETITDIWGHGPGDVYLTTSGGRVLHDNGAAWSVELAGGPSLRAVHGDRAGFVVAVGDGVIAFRQAGGWVTINPAGLSLEAVAVRSPLDAWMVGHDAANRAVQLHFDGVVLRNEPLDPPVSWGPLTGVVAGASDDVWIVGGNGPVQLGSGGVILHYDGAAVRSVPSSVNWMSAMAGVDVGDLWAAAYQAFSQQTTVRHFDGAGWRRRDLTPVGGVALAEVATVADTTWLAGGVTLVRHDDRRTVTDPARLTTLAPPGGFGGAITALAATAADQAFVFVGATAWRYQAGAANAGWSSTMLSSSVVDAWATGGHVFAVGGDRLHHFDGAAWSSEIHGGGLRAVGGTAVDDVWFAGAGFHHRTGPGTFQDLPPPPFPLDARAVFAAAPSYVVFVGAINGGGGVATWTGSQWRIDGPWFAPEVFHAITGSSPTDLWAVGERTSAGYTAHWDGSTWTPIELPALAGKLRATRAAGAGDVWAVGDGGEVLHLDHRLTALTGGDCPAAAPVGCSSAGFSPFVGAVVDGPVHYVLDAAFTGTATVLLTSATSVMRVAVLERGGDGSCDRLAPLATSLVSVQVALTAGRRYYLEVSPTIAGQVGGYQLELGCRKP